MLRSAGDSREPARPMMLKGKDRMMPNIVTLKIGKLHHDDALLANAPPQRNARVSSHEVLQGAIGMW